MKIYTKTGDNGETGLFGGSRVRKDDLRIEAYGDIDELNALLGVARSLPLPEEIDCLLNHVQNDLFSVGAELATLDPQRHKMALIGESHVEKLEAAIDRWEALLKPLRQFVLPGGSPAAAALHTARTVCRRAERRIVSLAAKSSGSVSSQLLIYVNRLSDLLFVLARSANSAAGRDDVPWQSPKLSEKP